MTTTAIDTAPPVYGLVLAGGKSLRMGQDKGAILWHGQEQRHYMAGLLGAVCDRVFISCRQDQLGTLGKRYPLLPDTVSGAGPLCAILSAFAAHPGVAWLVAACDLPLLDEPTLQYLLTERDSQAMATTFLSPHDGLPEPLITIWEPAGSSVLQELYAANFNCPRKALIRNLDRVKTLTPPNPDALINANTPDDADKVRQIIAAHKG